MSFFALELCAGGGGQASASKWPGFIMLLPSNTSRSSFLQLYGRTGLTGTLCSRIFGTYVPTILPELTSSRPGKPCPPFSIAGKQLGSDDERDMFPAALAMEGARPRGILFENVPGFALDKFKDYRNALISRLSNLRVTKPSGVCCKQPISASRNGGRALY